MSLKQCNFDKITNLRFHFYDIVWNDETNQNWRQPEIEEYVETFCDLLVKFQNIRFLSLRELSFETSQAYNKLVERFERYGYREFRQKIFNKLEGFCFHGNGREEKDFYNKLLHQFSDKLVSLHIEGSITAPSKGFPNLKELCLRHINHFQVHNIIQTATNLERIHLEFLADYINSIHEENQKHLARILVELLNQKSVSYILIHIDQDIDMVLDILTGIDLENREEMRFILAIKEKSEKVLEYLNILEDKLKMNGNDWVLKVAFVLTEDMLNVQKKINGNEYEIREKIADERKYINIVKTNDDCKLNGYCPRWIHTCSCTDIMTSML